MTDDSGRIDSNSEKSFNLGDAFVTLYTQLRAIARGRMANNAALATLQPTALVNEALVRLLQRPLEKIADEKHLLALASQTIRHVIVDHVRRKRARGGIVAWDNQPADDDIDQALATAVDRLTDPGRMDLMLDLDAALVTLSSDDPELRTIVELHCYAAMGHAEIAAMLHLSERTVRRRWRFAAAHLRGQLAVWMEPNVG